MTIIKRLLILLVLLCVQCSGSPSEKEPTWAVISWNSQNGIIRDRDQSYVNVLSVPKEHWNKIRAMTYGSMKNDILEYDDFGKSVVGYAMYHSDLGAPLTPIIEISFENDTYYCIGMCKGILVTQQ